MTFDIQLPLPEGWTAEQEVYQDESGAMVTHFHASLSGGSPDNDDAMIDIYVGETPEGETAEDQALANYAEVVGFDEQDPEDFNPIEKIKFCGRNAWGFSALCEDDSPMNFLSLEVRKGVLAIIVCVALDEKKLNFALSLVERHFRVR